MIAKTPQASTMRMFVTRTLSVMALSGAMIAGAAADSSAQVLKRAVQGGLLGAGVGAIAGGGRGAGTGAAIGAGVGAVVGAGERANAERRYDPPPRYTSAPPPPQPAYNDPLVYDIQGSLSHLGYDPGPIDGVYGQRTADAIRAYEYNNRLPLTGEPSPELRDHLYDSGG